MTTCEELIYDKHTAGIDWRERFRRCRKTAEGTVYGVALCTCHGGMLMFHRELWLCDSREVRIPLDEHVVRADADGE